MQNFPKQEVFNEDPSFPVKINKVIKYVKENHGRQIKESEVAAIACLSEAAFCRFFKKTTGWRFIDYVNEIRIREASRLLSETKDRVVDIAYTTGFYIPHYFNKIFKRSWGMTPSEFRQRCCPNPKD